MLEIPEDMLRDKVEAADRPAIAPIAQPPCAGVVGALLGGAVITASVLMLTRSKNQREPGGMF